MLVDTDVLIWNLRGNRAAAQRLDDAPGFWLSAVTYMELVQGMRNLFHNRAATFFIESSVFFKGIIPKFLGIRRRRRRFFLGFVLFKLSPPPLFVPDL